MDRKMLITRPEHEEPVYYLSRWSEDVIRVARRNSVKVFDLNGGKAVPGMLHSFLESHNPRFVMFNGHGSESSITGHRNEMLVDTGNASSLKDRIVYSISCKSARKLGPLSVRRGCSAFIGYDDDFIMFTDNNKSSRPLQDGIARSCLEPAMQLPVSIVKGNTVSVAYGASKNAFLKKIESLFRSKEIEAPYILQSLIENMENLVYHGNGNSVAW